MLSVVSNAFSACVHTNEDQRECAPVPSAAQSSLLRRNARAHRDQHKKACPKSREPKQHEKGGRQAEKTKLDCEQMRAEEQPCGEILTCTVSLREGKVSI